MAPLRLCLTALALALVTARASVTVSWNTARSATAPAATAPHSGVVAAVRGTRVILRMRDGTTRVFTASATQAAELRKLVGTVVQFRSSP